MMIRNGFLVGGLLRCAGNDVAVGFGLLLMGCSGLLWAGTPTAGSLQQQLAPQPALAGDAAGLEGLLTPVDNGVLPTTVPFMVSKITIVGNVTFAADVLHQLVAGAEGKEHTLVQLDGLAQRITGFYRQQGYSLSRAIIPAQEISDGQVTIAIVEAKFGAVELVNNSKVNEPLLQQTIGNIIAGDVIADANLYTNLLLLSDIAGVSVQSTLSPGGEVGHSDVQLQITDAVRVSGSVAVDQYGDTYTGQERLVASANINNLAKHGDVLSLNGMVTSGDLKFGRMEYDWLLNGNGSHIGAAYSSFNYALGKDLASLQAYGTSRVASAWFKHPLKRSLTANVNSKLEYQDNQLKDHVDSSGLRTDRTLKQWTVTVSGDTKDALMAGGNSYWNVGLTRGTLGFDDATAKTDDATAGQTQGKFSKLNMSLTHMQAITPVDALQVTLSGQKAYANLDSSQKMGVGGPSSVRAYKSGTVSGDSGYFASLQWNHQFGALVNGLLTGSVFFDSAGVTINHAPWAGLTAANTATLSGAGLAVSWANADQLFVSLSAASSVGPSSSLVTDAPEVRVWLQVTQAF